MKKEGRKMPKKGEKPTEKQLAALEKGRRKFVSGDEWTRQQQAKGVAAGVNARQEIAEKKTFAQHLAEELELLNGDGKPRKKGIAKALVDAIEMELAKEKPNGTIVVQLFQAIRDTIGEKPQEKVEVAQEKPFEITIKVE